MLTVIIVSIMTGFLANVLHDKYSKLSPQNKTLVTSAVVIILAASVTLSVNTTTVEVETDNARLKVETTDKIHFHYDKEGNFYFEMP